MIQLLLMPIMFQLFLGFLPVASVAGAIWLLVKAIIVFAVVMLSDKMIAHEITAKHSLILSIAAYFVIPILVSFTGGAFGGLGIIALYGLPLVVWIILGEFLLAGDIKSKFEIAFIAFVVYIALEIFGFSTGIPQAISASVPF